MRLVCCKLLTKCYSAALVLRKFEKYFVFRVLGVQQKCSLNQNHSLNFCLLRQMRRLSISQSPRQLYKSWGLASRSSGSGFSRKLQRKSHLFIPFLGIARPQPQFPYSCVCERFIYSPRIGLHISSSWIGRPGIFKSLTDAWMWKLGLRPRYSFSGNISFEISVFCLCSVDANPALHNEKLNSYLTERNPIQCMY